jgi:hypothetical protein
MRAGLLEEKVRIKSASKRQKSVCTAIILSCCKGARAEPVRRGGKRLAAEGTASDSATMIDGALVRELPYGHSPKHATAATV